MRRFQTKNTDAFLKMKFWIIRNEELAKQLGIDSSSEMGDLYLIRAVEDIPIDSKEGKCVEI